MFVFFRHNSRELPYLLTYNANTFSDDDDDDDVCYNTSSSKRYFPTSGSFDGAAM